MVQYDSKLLAALENNEDTICNLRTTELMRKLCGTNLITNNGHQKFY